MKLVFSVSLTRNTFCFGILFFFGISLSGTAQGQPIYTPYTFSTLAGDPSVGSADGTNSAARFAFPYAIAVDPAGNVFVADYYSSTVRKMAPVGTNWVVTTVAGLAGSYGTADGTNSVARFFYPSGIAVDTNGNLYVADTGNSTVRQIKPVGTNWVVRTISGLAGVGGFADGVNSVARFFKPFGITVDGAGDIYVSDSAYGTIRRIAPMGTNWVTTTIAGQGLAFGSADGTNTAAQFNMPQGLGSDNAGNLYVADQFNSTIRKVTRSGTNWITTTIAGAPQQWANVDGTNSDARFYFPSGIAVDTNGNVFVAQGTTMRMISPEGTNWIVSTIAGWFGTVGGADGPNSQARFQLAQGVSVDAAGNLYVADNYNCTVRQLTRVATNWVVRTLAGLSWSLNYESVDGTNSTATFSGPQGIAVDSTGHVYVADEANNTIRRLAQSGTNWVVTTIAGSSNYNFSVDGSNDQAGFAAPRGIAVDAAGNLFVTDNVMIRKITRSGTDWVVTTIAGMQGSYGAADGTNETAQFRAPTGIAVDATGTLFVTDEVSYTIRKITPIGTNWVVTTIAGLAGSRGDVDGTNSAARFDYPTGIAVDSTGVLYVADRDNQKIRKITPSGTNWLVTTISGNGSSGYIDGTNTATRFKAPRGIAVDSSDNLYVTDFDASAIRKLTRTGTNWLLTTIGGLPRAGSLNSIGSADGTGNEARFYFPLGVAVDNAGKVYVTDYNNSTIRMGVPAVSTPPVLSVTLQGNNLLFSWPTNATGFNLESATNFTPSGIWAPVGPGPAIVNGQNVVTNPISAPRKFFRLKK